MIAYDDLEISKKKLLSQSLDLEFFKQFLIKEPIAGRCTPFSPNCRDGQKLYSGYCPVSALAYINNIGMKIYTPALGNLNLLYQYIPKGATEVGYVYHSGLHFQALIPRQPIKSRLLTRCTMQQIGPITGQL